MKHISPRTFEQLVNDGLAMIPTELRSLVENLEVTIEDQPAPALLRDLGIPEDETLFGLYTGVPLTERTSNYSALPDRIIIYRQPLLEEFDDPEEIRHEVARTVIHEVAHHFGIDDHRLRELGWD